MEKPEIRARDAESPCQACGACCSYSQNWPRFTTEDDAALDLIPEKFVNEQIVRHALRRRPLLGAVGQDRRGDRCGIYAVRPEVCRTCMPGDAECDMARRRHGLPALLCGLRVSTGRGNFDQAGRLLGREIMRSRLARIFLIEFVLQRREGRERLGRERDRLAAVRGRRTRRGPVRGTARRGWSRRGRRN